MLSKNKYDVYIFILIVSLVTGTWGGAFQIPRLLTLVLIPNTILIYSKYSRSIKYIGNWCFAFIGFSALSILWTPAGVSEGIIGLLYNFIHIFLFIEIIVFSRKAYNPIKAITLGFLVTFIISAIIAFWELTTDNHLSLSNMDEAKTINTLGGIYTRYFASVTFYNLNGYVTFLCFLLPFLFYGFSTKNYFKYQKFIFGIALTSGLVLILCNGSRGGLLASSIMIIIYLIKFKKDKNTTILLIGTIALFIFIILNYGDTILNTLSVRLMNESITKDESRFSLWSTAMKVVFDYFFIGCGTNGIIYATQHYGRDGIIPHNLFLEILSQYGIVFFVVYIVFLFKIFIAAKRIKDINRKICIYQIIFALPVFSIINSGYLGMPSLYALMACLYVFAYNDSFKSIRRI